MDQKELDKSTKALDYAIGVLQELHDKAKCEAGALCASGNHTASAAVRSIAAYLSEAIGKAEHAYAVGRTLEIPSDEGDLITPLSGGK